MTASLHLALYSSIYLSLFGPLSVEAGGVEEDVEDVPEEPVLADSPPGLLSEEELNLPCPEGERWSVA